MKFLLAGALCLMASAQTVSIDVRFSLISLKDNYDTNPDPVAGETVRLVLGAGPDWQSPNAGHRFTTDEKGEAHFTMDALIDKQLRWRNIGFTPLSWPSWADHLQIATELEHRISMDRGEVKIVRWLLTMDLDCFKDGMCSTVGLMGIYPPDAQGRFSKALPRQGGGDVWAVPDMGGKVIRGMSYAAADFMMSADPANSKKRSLKLAFKRLPRIVQR